MIAKRNAKWVHAHASIWACDAQICVICKNTTIQKTKKMTTKLYLTRKQIMATNRKVMIGKSRFLVLFFNCTDNNETIEILFL